MGLREVAGIAMFAVALAITISLTFDSDDRGPGPAATISTGHDPPPLTAQPAATPTAIPTPVPVLSLGEPGGSWIVIYYSHFSDGDMLEQSREAATTVDLSFEHAPFPDMQDDDWSVSAEASFDRPEGTYRFSVTTTGNMDVSVNGRIVQTIAELGRTEIVNVRFDHLGGPMQVVVTARDEGGPFRLLVGTGR